MSRPGSRLNAAYGLLSRRLKCLTRVLIKLPLQRGSKQRLGSVCQVCLSSLQIRLLNAAICGCRFNLTYACGLIRAELGYNLPRIRLIRGARNLLSLVLNLRIGLQVLGRRTVVRNSRIGSLTAHRAHSARNTGSGDAPTGILYDNGFYGANRL